MINAKTISFPFTPADLQSKIVYNAAGDPEYVMRARPGALTSAAEWQISKITYDADRRPATVTFASGNNDYIRVADNYLSYSYS